MSHKKYSRSVWPIAIVVGVLALSACSLVRPSTPSSRMADSVPATGPWTLLPADGARPITNEEVLAHSGSTLSSTISDRTINLEGDSLGANDTRLSGSEITLGKTLEIDPSEVNIPDSLATTAEGLDSLGGSLPNGITQADSLANDTTLTKPKVNPAFDDIIEYKAQDSVVMLGTNLVYLFGPSTVDYKDKGLEANFMRLNADSNLVYAHYTLDSLGRPTAHPKFKDGGQSYEAKSMNYNFQTGKGFITGVVSQQGEGYVTAERTKKDNNDCMYMEGGRYTTCTNHEHPHFYLRLTRAKVRAGKNIVAGPSYLVIGDIPLPIGLPFGFFPFSSSYSSGVIMPSYGDETTRGIYLREGGYYFALSDYMDLAVTGDWYSRGSWGVSARSTYRKRYRYSGNFSGSYIVTRTGDKDVQGSFSESKDFRISWSHSQDSKANPNATFSANVNFSTSSYNHNSLNTLYNPGLSSQNTKSSSISYSRNFVGTPFRLSASLDATQTSSTQSVTLNSPNLSISMSRIYPFKRKKRAGAERWYEKISLSYTGQLRNSITTHEDSILRKNIIRDWNNGISHNIPISASYKLFDYIDLTLSANYTERWYSHKTHLRWDATEGKEVREREYGFNRVFDFSTSASMSTTFYGFFKPWRVFGDKLQMIRHRVTPNIGISYRPDFGTSGWGYYSTLHYTNTQGNPVDRVYGLYEGALFGSPGRGKSAAINFSLDNNLEAKLRSKPDSTGEVTYKKVSLIDNFSISTSYNLAADSMNLSDIQARLALKITKGLTLNLSGAFDPYMYTHTTTSSGQIVEQRINKLRILNGKGIGSLRGTGTSFSYTFNNQTFGKLLKLFGLGKEDKTPPKGNKDTPEGEGSPQGQRDAERGGDMGQRAAQSGSLYGQHDDIEYDSYGYSVNSIPWSLSVNYGVNLYRSSFDPNRDEYNYKLRHSLMLSGSIQPTKNWSFNFNASYDFDTKKLSNMTIGISRDLHCWSFTASAIPIGPYKSYNFTIGVKSSLLRDLKYDKHGYNNSAAWY